MVSFGYIIGLYYSVSFYSIALQLLPNSKCKRAKKTALNVENLCNLHLRTFLML